MKILQDFTFSLSAVFVAFMLSMSLVAAHIPKQQDQLQKLKGMVMSSENDDFLVGVHVYAKLAHQGAVSNPTGVFNILVKDIDTLVVTFVGYQRQIIPIRSIGQSGNEILIRMKSETIVLPGITVYAPPNIDYLKRPERTVMRIPGIQSPAKRPDVGVPIGSTDYSLMTRWGKEAKEKRKLMKVYAEDMSHVVYTRTVSSDSVMTIFMNQYDIDESGYNDFIIYFNSCEPLMDRQDPEDIVRVMHQYFLRYTPKRE